MITDDRDVPAVLLMGGLALVTQAGALSRPILEARGFEAVAETEILLDPRT